MGISTRGRSSDLGAWAVHLAEEVVVVAVIAVVVAALDDVPRRLDSFVNPPSWNLREGARAQS